MSFVFDFNDKNDFQLLQNFFLQLHRFLGEICKEQRYRESGPLFPEDMRAEEFLPEMFRNTDRDFALANDFLRYDFAFTRDRLAHSGLTGSSLRGKLRVLEYWAGKVSAPNVIADQFKKFLNKLLATINTLLGSFVQATGVGELIKELKETIENMIAPD
jgi:hypothetical protein